MRVAGTEVNAALGVLIAADADVVTCNPATLDELFLRHYQAAAS